MLFYIVTSIPYYIVVLVRQMVRLRYPQTSSRGTSKIGGPSWTVQSTVAIQYRNLRRAQVDQGGKGLASVQGLPPPG